MDVTPDYLLLGSKKANDKPKNITDNLKLCTDEEVRFVEAMTIFVTTPATGNVKALDCPGEKKN